MLFPTSRLQIKSIEDVPFHIGQYVNCSYISPGKFECDSIIFENQDYEIDKLGSPWFYGHIFICLGLVLSGGFYKKKLYFC